MSDRVYAFEEDRCILMGNGSLEAKIGLEPHAHLASLTNKLTGTTYRFRDVGDIALRLASPHWRSDILEWRFRPGSSDPVPPAEELGHRRGFHLPGTDASDWAGVQQLTTFPIGGEGYSAARYPGFGWYRQVFELPAAVRGKPIEFGLGGSDGQDWRAYWVYLNGTLIGEATTESPWHPVPRYILRPNQAAYGALRFGEANLLAVQACGLERNSPGLPPSDCERYSVGSPLVDQYVAVWPAYRELDEFPMRDHREKVAPGEAMVELQLSDPSGHFDINVRFWVNAGEGVLHKQVEVQNAGRDDLTLLEMDVHRLASNQAVSAGGWGWPCFIGEELFCGIRHPAGVSRGMDGIACLQLLPGRKLRPGDRYVGKPAVIGVGPAGQAHQAFSHYLGRHGPRERELISIYDIYGLHDIADMDDPTPVTEEMVLRNLDQLAELGRRGISFDYYFLDAGWSNPSGDLRDFDPTHFPTGQAELVRRIDELGMRFGLWVSPASGPMAFHPEAELPSLAQCGTLPGAQPDAKKARGSLCMASETWRTAFLKALLHHVRENGVRGFKLDGNALICTNPDHGHLPGKYSAEPIIDAMVGILETVRRECSDILVMYYWGIRSPWWLLYGDTLYERGVLMEGATPSDTPTRLLRQSVTLSLDQAAYHLWDLVPPPCHDCLGVWLSETRWASYMGAEGWQDAWIMEIGRGAMLAQLWGDLALLDARDIEFLADMSGWLRTCAHLLKHPTRILGDPWQAQPYGYAYFDGEDGAIFLHNPQFRTQPVQLALSEEAGFCAPAESGALFSLQTVYPPSRRAADRPVAFGEAFDLLLDPFEVRLVQVSRASTGAELDLPAALCREERSLALPCLLELSDCRELNIDDTDDRARIRRVVNGRSQYVDREEGFLRAEVLSEERDRRVVARQWRGTLELPPLGTGTRLFIVARLARGGIHWHHRAPCDIIHLKAALGGVSLPIPSSLPNRWHEQAGSWSWLLFELGLDSSDVSAAVTLEIETCLPESVNAEFAAWLFRD